MSKGNTGPDWKLEAVHRASIIRHDPLQVRQKIDPATVKRYRDAKNAGQEFPRIRVARVAGKHFLVAGWHRMAAGALEKPPYEEDGKVDAEVAEMTMEEAGWEAA